MKLHCKTAVQIHTCRIEPLEMCIRHDSVRSVRSAGDRSSKIFACKPRQCWWILDARFFEQHWLANPGEVQTAEIQ